MGCRIWKFAGVVVIAVAICGFGATVQAQNKDQDQVQRQDHDRQGINRGDEDRNRMSDRDQDSSVQSDRDHDRDRNSTSPDPARQYGFQDGMNAGMMARRAGHASHADQDENYRKAERGYRTHFGDKTEYQKIYREAYKNGYEQGYNQGDSDRR